MDSLDDIKTELQRRTHMEFAFLYFVEDVATLDDAFVAVEDAYKARVKTLCGDHSDEALEAAANRNSLASYRSLYRHVSGNGDVPERPAIYETTAKLWVDGLPPVGFHSAGAALREEVQVPFLDLKHGPDYVIGIVSGNYAHHADALNREHKGHKRDLIVQAADELFAEFQHQVLGADASVDSLYKNRDTPQAASRHCGIRGSL